MTANEFLSAWLQRNIRPVPYSFHSDLVKKFTQHCEAEAAREGITRRELEAAAGGNLKRHIATALEDAQDVVVKANKPPSSS